MKTIYKFIFCILLVLPIVACSAGSTSNQIPNNEEEYTVFNESYITMPVESSVLVTVYIMNPVNQNDLSYPVTFHADESGIVTFNPESCYFDLTQTIPSCSTTMYSIGVGSANVYITSIVGFHGQPLQVVVTN